MISQPLAHPESAGVTGPSLLDRYRPGSFFFASPEGSLLAQGVHARIRTSGPPALIAADARAALKEARATGIADPIVVGALPFTPGGVSELVVPRSVWRGPPLAGAAAPRVAGDWSIRAVPDAAGYEGGVRELLRRIDAGELEKAVLARTLALRGHGRVDPGAILRALAHRDPDAYAFAVDLPAGGTLVGASPELLVRRDGERVRSTPLAGSATRDLDRTTDDGRGAALTGSAKDRHEHAFVVEAVEHALAPFCDGLSVPAAPSLICTPVVWHLSSRITGRLRDPATSSLELAAALHPTPAVCGVPREPALAAIAELELFDRGFYGGAVGWCDADGDGEWAVAIRCAEITGTRLRLFAGAGIVAGSRPADELAETAAKFGTLLDAIGARDVPLDGASRPSNGARKG